MTLQSGAMIAERYRLMRLIATGGMGQVWEGLDIRLDRRVAVKVLKAEFSDDPEFLARFRIEAQTTARLNHPGIANVFDYGETPDRGGSSGQSALAYLVMELVNGEPLSSVLARMGRLPLNHALDMLEQTGRALKAAHDAGLVHRDVKPGNILITATGQVKITDFGIAKAVDAAPVTKTGMVMGTAQYISPEQALGEDATAASDVYSLGVVGYEAIAGRRPFLGDGAITVAMKHIREEPPPLPVDLPSNVRELIDIAMVKDPAQRYGDGEEFADAVAAVRAGRRPPAPHSLGGAVSAAATTGTRAMTTMTSSPHTSASPATSQQPESPSDDEGRWTAGQKALAGVAGLLLLVAICLVAFFLLRPDDSGGGTPTPSIDRQPTTPTLTITETPTPTQRTTTRTTTTETPTTTTPETTDSAPETTDDTPTTPTTTSGNGFTLQLPSLPFQNNGYSRPAGGGSGATAGGGSGATAGGGKEEPVPMAGNGSGDDSGFGQTNGIGDQGGGR